MNVVTLVGNLGSDPETRATGGGMVIATLKLATEDRVKKGDSWEKETQWHRVIVFGKTAENCAQYLSKGKKVAVVGKVKYRTWDKDDGTKGYVTEIVADSVEFLSPREGGGGGGDGGGGRSGGGRDDNRGRGRDDRSSGSGKTSPKSGNERNYDEPDDDDIPF